MNSKLNFIITGATAAMLLLPMKTDAQKLELGLRSSIPASVLQKAEKTTPGQMEKLDKKLQKRQSMLFSRHLFKNAKQVGLREMLSGRVKAPAMALQPRVPLRAAKTVSGRELWASILNDNTWSEDEPGYGVYKFNATNNITLDALGTNENIRPNGSGAIVGDRMYFVNYISFWGMIFSSLYTFDTDTWEQVGEAVTLEDYSLIGLETATAADGSVYGEFYNADGSGLELGIVDYANQTRTTIGSLSNQYVALGISKDNTLYGVATDGNLYKIDATTAKETLVGATGVKVSDDEGAYYQSGEIDQKDDVFYWASVDVTTNVPALYTIDLTTGAATMVGEFANQNILSMLTVPTAVADGAPAEVTNLKVNFSNGSLSGMASFIMPAKNAKGDAISGDVKYTIASGKDVLATGTAGAGNYVVEPIAFTEDGKKTITVYASNDEGDGIKSKATVFVGYDTPKQVEDLTYTLDKETGAVKVTWSPVTAGINDGYLGDVKYDVVRYPDNKVVASGTTATSFSETLPKGNLSAIAYGVKAKTDKKEGAEARTDYELYGDAIVPPYVQNFDDPVSIQFFNIIDSNNDGRTWGYDSGSSADPNGSAKYTYSASNQGDDWLISPPLKLEKGKVYAVSFKARANSSYFAERMEVKYGTANTAEGMTNELLPSTDITSSDFVEYTKEIAPTESGTYYIGFHALSNADSYYLYVDDLSIEAGASTAAPDAPTDLTVTAGDKGAKTAKITFKAPAKTIGGDAISGKIDVKIKRDGKVIEEMKGVSAGGNVITTDKDAAEGFNTYSVVASNSNGDGRRSADVKVYVGVDTPDAPETTVADNISSVKVGWTDADKGANGGYVDKQTLAHNVYTLEQGMFGYTPTLAGTSEAGATSYDLAFKTDEGDQELVNFGVSATNDKGESQIAITPSIISGAAYAIPFAEDVDGEDLNGMWWLRKGENGSSFTISTISTSGEGGSFLYQSQDDADEAVIGSGKIKLAGATNPMLIFSHKADKASKGKITVLAQKPDGTTEELKTIDASADNGEWTREAISLKAEYASLPYIVLQFKTSAATDADVYMDEFYVRDIYESDLTLSAIDSPAKIKKGETAQIDVEVTNFGSKAAKGYTVKLYAGDKLIDSKAETETLEPFGKKTYSFNYKSTILDEGSSKELKAVVDFDNDLNPDDNSLSTTIEFATSNKPRPASVSATENGAGNVDITWSAVNETNVEVNDGFEDYESWAEDEFGDWTATSGTTGTTTGGLFQSYKYPGQGDDFAFIVVDPLNNWITEDVLSTNENLRPHGGSKYAAAFYKYVGEEFKDADDWLISPTLSGKKQTVKFYVSNSNTSNTEYAESFDVMYSTGGTATSDFKKIGDTHVASSGTWEEVSVEIPEGATRFAIHRITDSEHAFLFQVDDVTYEAGSGKVTGYNVYRDGELLTTVSTDKLTFTDETAEKGKTYVYAVTAVFNDGESEATIATAITTDIESVENVLKASSYNVYTIDGKLIGTDMKTLKGLKQGSYIINDQKVIIR